MVTGHQLGYTTLDQEIVVDRLPVRGAIPLWLSGSLLRNGPARFESGQQTFRHWFDGFAMLHRFSFHAGQVSYANKFLRSEVYTNSLAEGRLSFGQFATGPYKAFFHNAITVTANANASIHKVADAYVAMTETPLPVAFDPRTLDTLGMVQYEDQLVGHHGSAHPHYDIVRRQIVSFLVKFDWQSMFQVYAIDDGSRQRRLIGVYPVQEPSYVHSIGLTEHYIVIAEYPYRVNPLALLSSSRPFIENYTWRPEEGAQFILMRRDDGQIVGRYRCQPFFAFHHINAFERDDEVLLDLSAYPDPSPIDALYLTSLRGNQAATFSPSEVRRYHLPLGGSTATYELLAEHGMELPAINYQRCNARDYGVAYGVDGRQQPGVFMDRLVRLDVHARATRIWAEDGCYPGEPIFVEQPGAQREDDGVVLSVVLDARRGVSLLLVLDAHSFTEVGRAEVPHHIPFGLHGQYFAEL